jgi:hypothetical protein
MMAGGSLQNQGVLADLNDRSRGELQIGLRRLQMVPNRHEIRSESFC